MSDSHYLSGLGVRDLRLGLRVQCRVEGCVDLGVMVLGFGLPLFLVPVEQFCKTARVVFAGALLTVL